MAFGTANFELRYDATGVRDQVEEGAEYGRGFVAQQWLGAKRLFGRRSGMPAGESLATATRHRVLRSAVKGLAEAIT